MLRSPTTFIAGTALILSSCSPFGERVRGVSAPAGHSFYRDVEPILQQKCQGCHVENGIAPFALQTYGQAKEKAALIEAATASKKMPPWPPSENGLPLS